MRHSSRPSISPGTAIALIALFFALGGSALAVGERMGSPSVAQQRCTNGAVRGFAIVTGDREQGHGQHPRQLLGRQGPLRSKKFNCTGKASAGAPVEIGVYELRFVGNGAQAAVANGLGTFSASWRTSLLGRFRVASITSVVPTRTTGRSSS